VSEGPQTGPADEDVRRAGTPPVPPPVAADPFPAPTGDAGRHRTEQVPFPLPPVAAPGAPPATPGPPTGRLQLGGYPPRVPGAGAPRPPARRREDAGPAQLPDDGADDEP
jgi:hypothetical protein